jgi:nucleotide-binding universal stress UspA family protein
MILVPLDGSPLAEAAIPHAAALAEAIGSEITLVIVWEEVEESLLRGQPDLAAQIALSGQEACRRYVEEQAQKLRAEKVDVSTKVLTGRATNAILETATEVNARFIALSSHGRGGIQRWWAGSVATAIMRHATIPELVVGPEALQRPSKGHIKHILVPLDGSELGEHALRIASEIVSKTGGRLLLVQVLRWSTQAFLFGVPDVDAARVDEELTKASGEYLEKTKAALSVPSEGRVLHGIPADELLKVVEDEDIDLVVMGTHGRGALMRVALGSVAERMVHAKAPVLLVREAAPDGGAHK